MLSFEEAGIILDQAAETLPRGIYDGLNGGVNLIPEERRDRDGNFIMGLYHHDEMGRYVEIFYGSFAALYADDDARFAAELGKTLRHELTHHVENKAGDRTLERWDEEQKLLWELGGPLRAGSILFVDEDSGFAAEACAQFRDTAAAAGLKGVKSDSAGVTGITRELLDGFEAVLCMTEAQAETLAEKFPEYDERLLCLGERDILPPRARAMRLLRREIRFLVEELASSGEGTEFP